LPIARFFPYTAFMREIWVSLGIAGASSIGLGILAFLPVPPIMLVLTVLFALAFFAHRFGGRWFPNAHPILATAFGAVTLLAFQAIAQTTWYYLRPFTGWTGDLVALAIAILLSELLLLIPWTLAEPDLALPAPTPRKWQFFALVAPATALLIAVAFVLFHAAAAATDQSIRTPWQLLPAGTLAALALAALAAWLIAIRRASAGWVALAASGSLLAFTLITPLLYRLGFGFDGFLHRASEQLLLTTGTLSPKPPYYIGQYVFVTWLSRLSGASIHLLDLWLVPMGAALLPLGAALALGKKNTVLAVVAGIALLPLGQFIVTTPQSFAYLIGILGLWLAAADRGHAHPTASLSLCAWSLAIHPLAGLPFLGGWIALQFRGKNPLTWLAVLGTSASVPAAFYLNSLRSGGTAEWHFERFFSSSTWEAAWQSLTLPVSRIALWPDAGVFAAYALPILLAGFAVYGLVSTHDRRRQASVLLALGIGACLAGIFLKTTGDFRFLIDYERGNYADRLFVLAECFWLIPASFGLAKLVERAWASSATVAASTLLLLTAWQGMHAYASLPRHDAAVISHGWSVGRADLDAVHYIHQDAGSRPYTVLANQSVSAAAVEAYGFKRYVTDPQTHEQVFYYPIPTGGPLYDIFLRAAKKEATRDTIKEAAVLGQSDLVYVVINDYWWEADQVNQTLASSTSRVRSFGNGADTVYAFDFSKDTN
jgi:hypothetical protein